MYARDTFEAIEKERIYAAAQTTSAQNASATLRSTQTPMQELHQRIMTAAARVHTNAEVLANHSDRLRGARPTSVEAVGRDSTHEGGALGEVLDALSHLESRLSWLDEEVGRAACLA